MAGIDNDVLTGIGLDVGEHPNSEGADNSTEFERSGEEVTSIVNNTSNTADSGAVQEVKVAGTSAGNVYSKWTIGDSSSMSFGFNATNDPNVAVFNIRNDGDASPDGGGLTPLLLGDQSGGSNTRGFALVRSSLAVASAGERAGSNVDLNVQNVETDANSNATITIQVSNGVDGGGGGNAIIFWVGPANNWFAGVDKSDGNKWKLTQGVVDPFPTGTQVIHADPSGIVSLPSIPGNSVSNALQVQMDSTTGELGTIPAGSGLVLQEVYTQSSGTGSTTTIIPADNTIPQNTEGEEVITLSITPKSATSILEIFVSGMVSTGTGISSVGAFFVDSTADAIFAQFLGGLGGAGANLSYSMTYRLVSGSTSARTYKFRMGPASAGTVYWNQNAGGNGFSVNQIIMRIKESTA